MNESTLLTLTAALGLASCGNAGADAVAAPEDTPTPTAEASSVEVRPIAHATFVLVSDDGVIYNDPVGGAEAFDGQPVADLILLSDIHPDHLDTATLGGLLRDEARTDAETRLVAPAAVVEQLPDGIAARTTTVANGETAAVAGVRLEALPMYNLREEALRFHPKGRGNGYVLDGFGGERIYIAGDTEDIPEMRQLGGIDRAFVPMNLPYTMPVEAAADAVVAFRPAIVHPYHYRGEGGLSDVGAFAKTVDSAGVGVEVAQLEWYPGG